MKAEVGKACFTKMTPSFRATANASPHRAKWMANSVKNWKYLIFIKKLHFQPMAKAAALAMTCLRISPLKSTARNAMRTCAILRLHQSPIPLNPPVGRNC